MKRKIDFLIVALFAVVLFASCERVAPNYAGVLMENYGKQAKADLETLNSDIDAEIEKNKSVISTLTSKNTELASLKSNNEGSIKTFAKFLK